MNVSTWLRKVLETLGLAPLTPEQRMRIDDAVTGKPAGSGPKPTASSNQFRVLVDDNFHFHRFGEEEWDTHGAYPTLDAAIAEAKKIVDESLRSLLKPGFTSAELYREYGGYGKYPMICGPGIDPGAVPPFRAGKYAKQRCTEICPEAADKPLDSAKRPTPVLPARSPEVERRLAEVRAGLGQALVANLNRNVLAEQSKENTPPAGSATERTKGRALAAMTPEQRQAALEWSKGLGQSLVDNLNRNVLKEHGPEPKSKSEPPKKG
jgi:hypothetical protein